MKILFGIILIGVVLFLGSACLSACIDNFKKDKSGASIITSVLLSIIIIFLGFNIIKFITVGFFTHKEVANKPQIETKKVEVKKEEKKVEKTPKEIEQQNFDKWFKDNLYISGYSNTNNHCFMLEQMVKNNMNNPASFKMVETAIQVDNLKGATVIMKYSGTNAFGGVVANYVKAYADYKANTVTIQDTD